MTTENENQETAEFSPVHNQAAIVSAGLVSQIRQALKSEITAQARCLIVSALEAELTQLRKLVRPAFEVEIARRSLDRLEANRRKVFEGSPDVEEIHTWDGVVRAAQRKLAKAETELGRTPPL